MAKEDVSNTIISDYKKHEHSYLTFAKKVKQLIEDLLIEYEMEIHSIDYRVKTEDSLQTKLKRKNYKYKKKSDITDIVGIRIVTRYEDTVDNIASIIESEFCVDDTNTIDKRKAMDPDRFGYLSLHYIVSLDGKRSSLPEYRILNDLTFEIQIRSILQHAWAEAGHDLGYKSKVEVPRDVQRDFSRLAGLLELADKELISIRDKLDSYREATTEQIKNQSTDFSIDNISLAAYIKNHENSKRLDSSIEKITNSILDDNLEDDFDTVDWLIRRLHGVQFETINEIDESLVRNFNLCLELAQGILDRKGADRSGRIVNGIGILYLCYAVLLKKGDYDLLRKYCRDNNIEYSDKDPDVFVNNLISIYEEYESKTDT